MITLIAESKTMSAALSEITPEEYARHRPPFDGEALQIMASLCGLSQPQLAATFKVGPKTAAMMREYAYDFADRRTAIQALDAFTGVVFKSFGAQTLPDSGRAFANGKILIISSLYGMLRPDDLIRPYRLDFTMKAAPAGGTMMSYWRKPLTDLLLDELGRSGDREILDLLPADAARCIDMERIRAAANVYTATFKEQSGPRLKTPHSGRLKELRGMLLRQIVNGQIDSAADLRHITSDAYIQTDDGSSGSELLFITA